MEHMLIIKELSLQDTMNSKKRYVHEREREIERSNGEGGRHIK